MQYELTEDNFIMFAVKNYDNPGCHGMDEFYDDLKRFKYIKRLLRKHNVGKDLKERLILNHIIVLGNLFGVEATTKMFIFKFYAIESYSICRCYYFRCRYTFRRRYFRNFKEDIKWEDL